MMRDMCSVISAFALTGRSYPCSTVTQGAALGWKPSALSGRRLLLNGLLLNWLLSLLFVSCTDEVRYSADPRMALTFSADTIAFDTLFTDVGSATGVFQVYNPNDVHLQLTDIRLAGGWGSPFRVNVDGQYGVQFSDVELRAGDSLYVFVEVTVDPTDADMPFEVCDSLMFVLSSGTTGRVVLTASGWNAVVLRAAELTADTLLTAHRPYLVYDSLVVRRGVTLTLAAGTGLYFHGEAYLRVDGTLRALGTRDSVVTFRGDRLDNMFSYLPYDRIRGQWGGIVFGPSSRDNVLVHCDVHSASYGLCFERPDSFIVDAPTFIIESTVVHNIEGDALQATLRTGTAVNSLFSNAGGHCVNLLGGYYDFVHCTLASFYPWMADKGAALHLRNVDDNHTLFPLLGARFANCIITGRGDDEIEGTIADTGADSLDLSAYAQYAFSHSLINSTDAGNPHFTDIVWESPDSTRWGAQNFLDFNERSAVYDYDFHLDSLSRARGIGDPLWLSVAPLDLDAVPRDSLHIDAGCYQYVDIKKE